jgi:hypothetical protein
MRCDCRGMQPFRVDDHFRRYPKWTRGKRMACRPWPELGNTVGVEGTRAMKGWAAGFVPIQNASDERTFGSERPFDRI